MAFIWHDMNQRVVKPVQCVLNSGRNVILDAPCSVGLAAWWMTTGLQAAQTKDKEKDLTQGRRITRLKAQPLTLDTWRWIRDLASTFDDICLLYIFCYTLDKEIDWYILVGRQFSFVNLISEQLEYSTGNKRMKIFGLHTCMWATTMWSSTCICASQKGGSIYFWGTTMQTYIDVS